MRGTISKITGGEAKSGGRYETWVIDGEKYSTKKFVGCAQEGDTIEFEYLKNGNFKNLTKVELATSSQKKDQNDYIIREVAIKAAAETAKAAGFSFEDKDDEMAIAHSVIKIAKEFEAYIKDDEEPEEPIPF